MVVVMMALVEVEIQLQVPPCIPGRVVNFGGGVVELGWGQNGQFT